MNLCRVLNEICFDMDTDLKLLNLAMRTEARSLGLCDEWFGDWSDDEGVDELLNKMMKGVDFCLKHRFPSNEILLKYAGREKLREHRIFIDDEIDGSGVISGSGVYYIGGGTKGTLVFDGFDVATVYVTDDADVGIHPRGMSKVFVETWHDGRVWMHSVSANRCFVYQHGGDVNVLGDVIVRDKR